ncbi:MAG: prolyl oligopeptidase family serine peptidase [Lewinellaceae bacterium]|nr:prolyl oligopeptidase family serine peptidase [Lewinellaceae bacterium]
MVIRTNIIRLFTAVFLLLYVQVLQGQKLARGPQVLTFFSSSDDTEQPYGLYLPKKFSEKKTYPLVVMLHGAGSNHRLALRRVFGKSNAPGETDVEASLTFPTWADEDYIVVAPYARGTAGYQGFVEKDVYDMLADVKKRFRIDENRVYLTGLSMGGGGTLWLGLTRPDIWAAIAPVCPAPPKGTQELAPNALHLPVYFFHGDADQAVPVAGTRDWVSRLKELGTAVEYTEYPGVNHNSWENAYENGFIFRWFDKFRRNPYPDRVRFVSNMYKYAEAYWVRFDRFTPGVQAGIDARFTGPNQLEVTTTALDAFSLLQLQGHAKFNARNPLQVTVDGQSLSLKVKEHASFPKQNGKWTAEFDPAAQTEGKKNGAEGPVSEAFADRHIYVYGTLDNPSEDVLKTRMDVANEAANWSVDRGWFLGRIKFYPRVIADKDVRPSDLESSNLILFGTKETNSVIAKNSDQLPAGLDAAATGYGLFYIFPLGKHYVAVSSGLPWWTGAEPSGWRFLPIAQQLLAGYKDFVFFKDSAKNVLAEGYFDNNWRLPEPAVSAMKASKVIHLK